MFNISTLIKNKINYQHHNAEEINFIVNSYLQNNISNQSMTKWLKAVYQNGMNLDETVYYTNSIINSGEKIKFKNLDGYIVDKHSTGGVGDKVSIILGPILAACNCYVPMIVGRFLGHTGGTLDKLESIPGYNGLLTSKRFIEIVKNTGISIIGQTNEICPADRKIYSLRGETNTVASFPLICGSIMSKKIAEGIQGLVLDIKTGNGAFMRNSQEANKLGNLLSLIGSEFGIEVKYIYTNMNQPLGEYSGLLCEIEECIQALNGNGATDLMDVVFDLGEKALAMAGKDNPREMMDQVIKDGRALEILSKMIYEHGGNIRNIRSNQKNNVDIIANNQGYLEYVNTKIIGDAVNLLTVLNRQIDNNAGMQFLKKNGDYISSGDIICRMFGNNSEHIATAESLVKRAYLIKDNY